MRFVEDSGDLVTTAQAAEIIGRSVATVNRWAKKKILEPAWQGPGEKGVRLYRRADIEALVEVAS